MERRSSSPSRPRSIRFGEADSSLKSASPSPASDSENRQWSDDYQKCEEITEYAREVDELLDHIKPFPRNQQSDRSDGEPSRPRLDHLENLIRLVEQLKDLKEKNCEQQQRTRQFKEQRSARERRGILKCNREDLTYDLPPPPPDPPKKHRPSIPFRKNSRSKSISTHEYFNPERLTTHRKSISQGKAKVSKWTKVKEAFRWEKASQLETLLKQTRSDRKDGSMVEDGKPCEDIETSQIQIGQQSLYGHLLHVPEKSTDSPSPADSVLSGQISSCSSLGAASSSCLLASSGYSGEHSSGAHSHSSVHMLDLPESRHRFSHAEYLTQSLQELSSSSEDEKMEDSAFTGDHCKNRPIYDEGESRRSKSLDGEHVLGPTFHLLNLSKESLHEESKAPKQHKTPWGKVIDIIQTRKDSLKKRPKKRDNLRLDSDAFSSTIQPRWSSSDVHMSDDVSSPEDIPKDQKPRIEITYEKAPQPVLMARRLDNLNIRPLTPVLTLTRPSTEELQKLPVYENEETAKSDSAPGCSSVEDIQTKQDLSPEEKVCRASRWVRVKKAFLTSANAEDISPGPSSAPPSPMYLRSFFSDNESDELSSGEWVEDLRQDKILETPQSPGLTTTFLQAEVQRNYAELQQNISREMEVNENACELVKCLMKAGEKVDERSDGIPRKPRESLSIPLPTMDDLSPDFKKKLDEWKKIKKTPTTPTSSKEESQSHFISRIGEWQRWRPGSSSQNKPESHHFKPEHHFQDEFYKKLEEWQMLKGGKRSRSHSDRGKEDRDYQTPSPGLSRKNSKGASKKLTSGKSSGSESLSGSIKEKEGRAGRKSQKEKDLQWLEKELHKIEREKLRLEREREKYLEREARLEQMKRTMGSTTPTQEVLIQTATGFYRFEGISQKFTKKLYEWEKARGIAPEASTFALLETASVSCRKRDREDRIGLQRSKSVGSVIDSSSAAALSNAHHPSSLSLNDVDELEAMEQVNMLADAVRMVSDEPEAIIVDVEDVVEETASMMVDAPQVLSQVPVYSYAPAEVTQLIDSSGSDSEVQVLEANDERKVSTETLIEHNIGLLEKIEVKEAICREIENDLVDLNDKMSGEVEEPTLDPKDKLLLEGEHLKHSFLEHSEEQQEIVHDLVDNLRLLHAANCRDSESTSVNQVLDLTSDLLSLAKKLEAALKERSLSELQDKNYGKRKVNRLGKEKVWFSTDEEALGNSDKLKDLKGELEGIDSEVENLPSLITKKVLELKAGLSALKYKTDTANKEITQNDYEEEAEEQNDVSFTVQVARRGARASVISISDTKEKEAMKGDSDQKITSREHSPSPVAFIIPSPRESRSGNSLSTPKRGLEKSKAQIICNENAEEEYEKNLAVSLPRKEPKSPEVLKKKIREKIHEMQRISSEIRPRTNQASSKMEKEKSGCLDKRNEANDENKFVTVTKNGSGERLRKNLKARRITDTTIAYKPQIYIPTETRGALERENYDDVFLSDKGHPDSPKFLSETPKFVFVPTSRKIISPIETDISSSVISYVIDDIEPKPEEIPEVLNVVMEKLEITETPDISTQSYSKFDKKHEASTERYVDIGMPPLPNSPVTSKKLCCKETAPSIKLMIDKYNQKVTEKDGKEPVSGTSSPIGWRSPILERRIKAQMDRFQSDGDNALKNGSKFGREVIKSASAGLIKDNGSPKVERRKDVPALKGILKSSSTGAVRTDTSSKMADVNVNIPDTIVVSGSTVKEQEAAAPLALRALKIKQAKAEFLSRGPSSQSWTSDHCQTPTSSSSVFPWGRTSATISETRSSNRMSHLSVGSDSSYDDPSFVEDVPNLMKSASAGMLGLDRSEVLRRRSEGCVEQPCIQKTVRGLPTPFIPELPVKKSSKFGFSNIKSKFRKVKMRKSKDKESAVSTLCRQSLHLDVLQSNQRVQQPTCSKSCPASPVLDRSNSIPEDCQRMDSRKNKMPAKSKDSCSSEKR